jgi:lipid-A-disaccharide synthase-like uncharacterized protein
MLRFAIQVFSEKGLEESERALPAAPLFFGLFAFGTLMFLLYLVLRLDKD